MINSVDIRINAENPNFPMRIFRAFVNSPTSVRVRNVPSKIGAWKIDKVFVSVSYPDNEIHSKEFVKVDDIWVATIPASTVPGKSSNGYIISADGVDEKGNPVQGYIMGKGDVEILDTDGTITPGETTYYIHLLPSRPETPHKGDAYVDGGVWWFYNGSAWVTLGGTFAGNGWAQYPQSQGGDGKWHRVIIANGALAYDEQGFDEPPDAAPFALKSELTAETERATAAEQTKVPTDGNHTINGVKTFAQSPLVPTVSSTDENSQKAASTGWVTAKLAAWWAVVKAALTKADVGLANVDNTSDANKPVSIATQAALNAKANDNAVVKLTGNQAIGGIKSFASAIVVSSSALKRVAANSYAYFHGGTSVRDGATITLAGSLYEGTALPAGGLNLAATDGKSETGEGEYSTSSNLSLSPNGHLKLISSGPDKDPRVLGDAFAAAGMPSESFVDIAVPESGGYVAMPSKIGWLAVFGSFTADGVVSVCRTLGTHNNYGFIQRGKAGETFRFIIPVGRWANMNFSFIYSNASFSGVRFYSSMAEVAQ